MRTRADKLFQDKKHKAKSKALMKDIWRLSDKSLTPRGIGHMAATHNKPCSCGVCTQKRSCLGPSVSELRRMALSREDSDV